MRHPYTMLGLVAPSNDIALANATIQLALQCVRLISSGSLAMLAAIRRALSCDIKPDWLPMLVVLRK